MSNCFNQPKDRFVESKDRVVDNVILNQRIDALSKLIDTLQGDDVLTSSLRELKTQLIQDIADLIKIDKTPKSCRYVGCHAKYHNSENCVICFRCKRSACRDYDIRHSFECIKCKHMFCLDCEKNRTGNLCLGC